MERKEKDFLITFTNERNRTLDDLEVQSSVI